MPGTFDCPKCGAPVEFGHGTFGQPQMVRCNYCGSTLSEPSMGRPAQIVHLKIDTPKNIKIPRKILLVFLIPLLGVGTGIVAMIAHVTPLFFSSNKPTQANDNSGRTPREPEFASVLLRFGSPGIGPGMFTDARNIAVDGSGNIYVGEYLAGRIQAFDSHGKFLTQWMVSPNKPLRGLAADRKGNVYVVQSGNILKFEGATGKPLGEVKYSDGGDFDDIVTTADGGLVCAWYRNRDDIVRFDSNGDVVLTIEAAISSTTGQPELNTRVAADGLGTIYALGSFSNAVFRFGADGRYINRFSGKGDQPGQLRSPMAIAVDGKGRIYVADIRGVQVFDSDGRYLNSFKPDGGYASGMTFTDNNELFVVDRNKVVKLKLRD